MPGSERRRTAPDLRRRHRHPHARTGTRSQAPLDIDIYFTHTHLDHLSGLTFFAPLFDARSSVRMWAGHLEAPYTLKKVVSNLMQAPIYPVTLEIFKAKVSFTEFRAGDSLTCGVVQMRTAPLNHPNGATGYRIVHGGKAICYITDTEHRPVTST
jgi:phosphoribosyl 1,2-cyclic phosphodiesterase